MMTSVDPAGTLIRPSTSDDVAALDDFIQPFVAMGRLLPRTPDELEDLMKLGFIAESEGRIIGFASLEIYSKKLAEVRSLAVAPEFQGHGIGKRLVEACIDLARTRNILEVMAITSSDGFFKSCGFDFTLPGEKKALFIQTRDL